LRTFRGYYEEQTAKVNVDFIKNKCLSSKVLQYVSHEDSLDEILFILNSLFKLELKIGQQP
jgi:hypothetical protein